MTACNVQTAATAPEAGAAPEPAHGAEVLVPLNRLKASPEGRPEGQAFGGGYRGAGGFYQS